MVLTSSALHALPERRCNNARICPAHRHGLHCSSSPTALGFWVFLRRRQIATAPRLRLSSPGDPSLGPGGPYQSLYGDICMPSSPALKAFFVLVSILAKCQLQPEATFHPGPGCWSPNIVDELLYCAPHSGSGRESCTTEQFGFKPCLNVLQLWVQHLPSAPPRLHRCLSWCHHLFPAAPQEAASPVD